MKERVLMRELREWREIDVWRFNCKNEMDLDKQKLLDCRSAPCWSVAVCVSLPRSINRCPSAAAPRNSESYEWQKDSIVYVMHVMHMYASPHNCLLSPFVCQTLVYCLFLSLHCQFGDSQQLRLVRILRSTVMVRVGGGWEPLEEFLRKHDPCRG